MKTIIAYLTSLLITANAFAVFGASDVQTPPPPRETSPASQRLAHVSVPQPPLPSEPETVDLTELYAALARASKNADVDALRKLVDDNIANYQTPAVVKIQLAEAYCATQIDVLAQQDDLEGLAEFCEEIQVRTKGNGGHAFRVCFQEALERVAIYAPALAEKYEENPRLKQFANMTSYAAFDFTTERLYVPLFNAEPDFDSTLFNFESDREFEYYRDLHRRFNAASARFEEQVQRYVNEVDRSYVVPSDLEARIDDARIKLLRETVLTQPNEDTPQLHADLVEYLVALQKRSPMMTTNLQDGLKYEKFYEDSVGELLEERIFPDVVENFRTAVYTKTLERLFNQVRNASEEERNTFLTIYRDQLRRRPALFPIAVNMVKTSLGTGNAEFANSIAQATEDALPKDDADPQLMRVVGQIRSELKKKSLESTIGQKLEITGVDVNYKEFNLESLRGKYVVLYILPQNTSFDSRWTLAEKRLHERLKEIGSEKIEFVEYAESFTNDAERTVSLANLDHPSYQRPLEQKRANPWTTVAGDLTRRANLAYDSNYQDIFQIYEGIQTGARYALIDPQGVLIGVDSNPQSVLLRLRSLFGDESSNVQK